MPLQSAQGSVVSKRVRSWPWTVLWVDAPRGLQEGSAWQENGPSLPNLVFAFGFGPSPVRQRFTSERVNTSCQFLLSNALISVYRGIPARARSDVERVPSLSSLGLTAVFINSRLNCRDKANVGSNLTTLSLFLGGHKWRRGRNWYRKE
jgi:hypothetical protein